MTIKAPKAIGRAIVRPIKTIKRVETVQTVTEYVDREVPVEVIKEVVPEHIQEELDRLRAMAETRPSESMLEELEQAKARIDETKTAGNDYRFKVPFLQAERLVAEDLSEADQRLIQEYERLELSRPLEYDDDVRWRLLQSNLFTFNKG